MSAAIPSQEVILALTTNGEAMKFNKGVILRALRAAGIECVEATYSGSGDSGDSQEIKLAEGASHEQELALYKDVEIACRAYSREQGVTFTPKRCSLEQAIFNFMDFAILESGNDGFEDGDGGGGGGGGGELKFDVTKETVTLDHYDRVVTDDYDKTVTF